MSDSVHDSTTQVDRVRPASQETYLLVATDTGFAAYPMPRVGRLSIGRSSRSEVHIDHATVSRHHAEIEIEDGAVQIRDLGSANGTRVAGHRIEPDRFVAVVAGQPVLVGDVTVIVQRLSAAPAVGPGTGHQYVETRMREECARATRTGGTFVFARLEVSGSAPAGRVEDVLAEELRVSDVVAMTEPGCHELLLVDTDSERAAVALSRIAARLREFGCNGLFGVAHYPIDGTRPEQLLAAARKQLTERHRSSLADSPTAPWRTLVEQVADSHMTVLIRGETGVGKELCAAELHRRSRRRDAPFMKLNCAAFAESLLESELFGHEQGAFTGAVSAKPGLFEASHGGTVFLDEVGDLPLPLQAKLLRVLEDREVLRIGSVKPRRIDVRFVAATNRPLEHDIEERRFRRDLLYRLAGVVVEIPPLRERMDELDELVEAFIGSACREMERVSRPRLSRAARAVLMAQPWPGNIRELRNAVERAVLLCPSDEIEPTHLPEFATEVPLASAPAPAPVLPSRTRRASLNAELADLERRQILGALEQFGGNQTRAAKQLGMSRTTLQKRMDAYGVPRPRKRRPPKG